MPSGTLISLRCAQRRPRHWCFPLDFRGSDSSSLSSPTFSRLHRENIDTFTRYHSDRAHQPSDCVHTSTLSSSLTYPSWARHPIALIQLTSKTVCLLAQRDIDLTVSAGNHGSVTTGKGGNLAILLQRLFATAALNAAPLYFQSSLTLRTHRAFVFDTHAHRPH